MPILEPLVQEVDEIAEKSKQEVELSSQIDALVGTRHMVREDINKLVELEGTGDSLPVSSGLSRGVVRGVLVVISNVQIAPPRAETISDGRRVDGRTSNEKTASERDTVVPSRLHAERVGDDDESRRLSANAVKRARKRVRRHDKISSEGVGSDQRQSSGMRPSPLDVSDRPKYRKDSYQPSMEQRVTNMVVPDKSRTGSITMREGSRKTLPSGPSPCPRTRRVSKTGAVCIKRGEGGLTYAQILRLARERVPLGDLGINDTRIRWAANGAVLIEVAGENMAEKADFLAGKLRDALSEEAMVSRPIARGELRIWGLDDSVCPDEVAFVVAESSGCLPTEVTAGPIFKMVNGLGSVWVRCPLAAAVKLASFNKIRIGWTFARIELLQLRPTQCFRCWNYGHMRNKCKAEKDRSMACFRCGEDGHSARQCTSPPRCVVCEQAGRPSGHRMGSVNCGAVPARRVRGQSTSVPDRRSGIISNDNVL